MKRIWMKRVRVVLLAGIAALVGCDMDTKQTGSMLPPPEVQQVEPAGESGYLSKTAVSDETGTKPDAVVDMALRWSKRCSDLTEQLQKANSQDNVLRQENMKLKQQVGQLEAKLELAEKELDGANLLLMDLQKQLEHWKKNVLGYRNEMRNAQQVELEALTKILKLLGGEVIQTAAVDTGTKSLSPKPISDETLPVSKKTPPAGEKNQ